MTTRARTSLIARARCGLSISGSGVAAERPPGGVEVTPEAPVVGDVVRRSVVVLIR